jgi:exopolyphosphatase/guanosine-5'-triphosphate,3'-diphosphate pyrophosphatase
MTTNKHCAAIDLGSNSFHLIIVKQVDDAFQVLCKARQPIRLAAHLDDHGTLSPEGQQLALACLAHFRQVLQQYPDIKVEAVGTASFRRIKEPLSFCDHASATLGLPIRVLSGEEEAKYIYEGVCSALEKKEDIPRLVIDIGGGSTEVIVGTGPHYQYVKSFPVGCVVLQKKYYPDGVLSPKVIQDMQQHVDLLFEEAKADFQQLRWQKCFASSGTAQTLQLMQNATGLGAVEREVAEQVLLALKQNVPTEMPDFSAIKPDRQLIFTAGLVILTRLLSLLNVPSFYVSQAALREGILARLMQ